MTHAKLRESRCDSGLTGGVFETGRSRTGRSSRITVAVLLLTVLHVSGCKKEISAAAERPRPVVVEQLRLTLPSNRRAIAGVVEPSRAEDIAAEVSGRLEYVAQEGDQLTETESVRANDGHRGGVIAMIDHADYQLAVDAAVAGLERARVQRDEVAPAALQEAEARLAREQENIKAIRQVAEQGASSVLELTTAESDLKVAQANHRSALAAVDEAASSYLSAKSTLSRARIDLERAVVYAPFSGEVDIAYREQGGYANTGTPLIRLVSMDPIKVRVALSPLQAQSVRLGDRVEIRTHESGETLWGTVCQRATTADERTLSFAVTVLADNQEIESPTPENSPGSIQNSPRSRWLLRPGDVTEVRFDTGSLEPAFFAPVRSIRYESASSGTVFVVRDGAAIPVPVQLGRIDKDRQAIQPPDDFDLSQMPLIVGGAQYLHDHEPVEIVETRGEGMAQ